MAEEKRPYWLSDDDDGRTIVDMSGVKHRNMFLPHRFEDEIVSAREEDLSEAKEKPEREKNRVVEENGQIMDEAEARGFRPWEERSLNKEETRSFIFGATTAGLFLVGIFIAAGWLFIQFLLWVWS
ncbi:MAG: hypothetical protein IJ744_04135 [Lachnospiraceae bacterium]|nr:hypothetical protein [Lachnospiraceae bacterium]